ncbi:putative POM121-like protein 1 [Orcinus orca]|uniref:putative POM121-like protein 1 n=1 Tax=Orcinus orca TaxID=9733 RepID=UPI002112F74F|nr:putative POM121-like protein 1 [Orcinus orca]
MGILISIFRRGHRKKAVMGARTSTTSRSSVSAVDTVTVSVARGQPVPATTPSCVPNYSTEKTVLRALGESGQGMAKQEEVPTVTGKNDDQRSPNDTGGARSAFRPLGGSFFVPRPGPLQRDLHAKWAEDRSARKQQTSCMSSCPQRNAITSSYSSTRGFLPVERRRGPAIPQGLPQKSAKTGGEECPPSPSAALVVYQRKSQIPLLPHRRGEPLRLPPAPEPGFRVTAEDLDSEKEAAFQRINRALRDQVWKSTGLYEWSLQVLETFPPEIQVFMKDSSGQGKPYAIDPDDSSHDLKEKIEEAGGPYMEGPGARNCGINSFSDCTSRIVTPSCSLREAPHPHECQDQAVHFVDFYGHVPQLTPFYPDHCALSEA